MFQPREAKTACYLKYLKSGVVAGNLNGTILLFAFQHKSKTQK